MTYQDWLFDRRVVHLGFIPVILLELLKLEKLISVITSSKQHQMVIWKLHKIHNSKNRLLAWLARVLRHTVWLWGHLAHKPLNYDLSFTLINILGKHNCMIILSRKLVSECWFLFRMTFGEIFETCGLILRPILEIGKNLGVGPIFSKWPRIEIPTITLNEVEYVVYFHRVLNEF